jgi:hypothetical protein
MAKQELDLFEVAPAFSAELCAPPAKIMSPETFYADLLRRLLDY